MAGVVFFLAHKFLSPVTYPSAGILMWTSVTINLIPNTATTWIVFSKSLQKTNRNNNRGFVASMAAQKWWVHNQRIIGTLSLSPQVLNIRIHVENYGKKNAYFYVELYPNGATYVGGIHGFCRGFKISSLPFFKNFPGFFPFVIGETYGKLQHFVEAIWHWRQRHCF